MPSSPFRVEGGAQAEALVCGAAMYLAPASILEVAHVVDKESFLDPVLGNLWERIVQLAMAGKQVTPLTVNYVFNQLSLPEINQIFGDAFLHASKPSALAHAGIVAQQGVKIRAHKQLQETVNEQATQPRKGWWSRYATNVAEGQ